MKPIQRIADEELHLLIDSEIMRVPPVIGVCILYDGRGPIAVSSGELLNETLTAKARHPEATRFSLRFCKSNHEAMQTAEVLRKEFGLTNNKQPIGFSRPA